MEKMGQNFLDKARQDILSREKGIPDKRGNKKQRVVGILMQERKAIRTII